MLKGLIFPPGKNKGMFCYRMRVLLVPLKLWIGFSYLKITPGTTPEFPVWCRQPLTVPTCCPNGTSSVPEEGPLQSQMWIRVWGGSLNPPGILPESLRNPPAPGGEVSGAEEQQRKGSSSESLLDRAIPQSSSLGKAQISSSNLSWKYLMS